MNNDIKDGIRRVALNYVKANNLHIVSIIKRNPLLFVRHAQVLYNKSWGRYNRSGAISEPYKYKLIVEFLMSIGEKQDRRGYQSLFNGESTKVMTVCETLPTKQNK